jgi:hypothetical protein
MDPIDNNNNNNNNEQQTVMAVYLKLEGGDSDGIMPPVSSPVTLLFPRTSTTASWNNNRLTVRANATDLFPSGIKYDVDSRGNLETPKLQAAVDLDYLERAFGQEECVASFANAPVVVNLTLQPGIQNYQDQNYQEIKTNVTRVIPLSGQRVADLAQFAPCVGGHLAALVLQALTAGTRSTLDNNQEAVAYEVSEMSRALSKALASKVAEAVTLGTFVPDVLASVLEMDGPVMEASPGAHDLLDQGIVQDRGAALVARLAILGARVRYPSGEEYTAAISGVPVSVVVLMS